MKLRLIGLILVPIVLIGTLLYWGRWIGPESGAVQTLMQAEFTLLQPATENLQPRAVALPHFLPTKEQSQNAIGAYQVRIPAHLNDVPIAISMRDNALETQIAHVGNLIPLEKLTGRPDQVALAKLGKIGGGEWIDIRVSQRYFGMKGGLDKISIGPEAVIERQAWVISSLRYIGRAFSIALPMLVGIIAFAAYWFRPQIFLLSLSSATFAYSIQQAWVDLLGYWENDDARLAGYLFLSTILVFCFCLSFIQAARKKADDLIWVGAISIPLIALVLFTQTGSFEFRRASNLVVLIIWFVVSIWRSGPTLWRLQHWFLLFLAAIIALRLATVGLSVLFDHGLFSFAAQNRQMQVTGAAMIILTVFFSKSVYKIFENYEAANNSLRQEVDSYKTELAAAAELAQKFAVEHAAAMERDHWMQEIHDGLGSHLIAARFLADKASDDRSLGDVKDSIDDAIEQLRMLVESLSLEQTSIPSLLGAMRYRMVSRLNAAGLTLKWEVDPMIESGEATPIMALHVQRIISEAITNVLKHAQAKTIRVQIFTQGSDMVVRVEDDGKGCDDSAAASGRGISNMKIRAQKCGGAISWAALNPGTRVELRFPIKSRPLDTIPNQGSLHLSA